MADLTAPIYGKQEIYALLDERGLWHEVIEHRAMYSLEDAQEIALPYPTSGTRNLFLCDKKHREKFYLLSAREDVRVDLNAFRRDNGLEKLTFATEDEMHAHLALDAGVTPLGLLNNVAHSVEFYMDESFLAPPGIFSLHPNANTATMFMKTEELVALLADFGHETHVVRFE